MVADDRMSSSARAILVVVVIIAFLANLVLFLFSDGEPSPTGQLDVLVFVAILLFAWHPLSAAVSLSLLASAALVLNVGGPYVFVLALATGLVFFCCRRWVATVYSSLTIGFMVIAEVLEQGITPGASLGLFAIGVTSGLIGWVLRLQRNRVSVLNADVDRLQRELEQAVANERERISDELHDVVAHDITVLLMHTRVLTLPGNENDRDISVRAITEAAVQAMTDVKRMMRVMDSSQDIAQTIIPNSFRIQERIEKISEDFRIAGVQVETKSLGEVRLSRIVESTLGHVFNECVTNVMKHAPGTEAVRIELEALDFEVRLGVWNATVTEKSGVASNSSGYGLRRMEERVQLLGGEFKVTVTNDGWSVEAILPKS
ncbi:sensor histidine kinase [Leucobacter chinensis]|uniref:sensor histidine kinase n=1 Tax=Leucobacter chinensis TaxID=2851010 RepID=UPI001C232245